MAYKDPVTGRFSKPPANDDRQPPPLVHGLEWDDEPDVELPGGPSMFQIYLFAMAVVVVIVVVAMLVNAS